MIYGDFNLQRGDADATRKWGGQQQAIAVGQATAGTPTTLGSASPVADLQRDLATLGFLYVKGSTTPGEFDDFTEGAVRELQAYAKMAVAAVENPSAQGAYVERLSSVPTGSFKYAGHVSGVVNAGTRKVIEHWLAQKWRCPVVLDGWTTRGTPVRTQENVWRFDEVAGGLVVKARDFSGYYREQRATDPLWKIGKSVRYQGTHGPSGDTTVAWPELELTPELVFGQSFDSLNGANQSTFRVVRCVAEIECMGFFDIINAYDRAVVSTGLVHWTFLDGSGELSELLVQLAEIAPADYAKAFVFFGLDVRTKAATAAHDPVSVKLEDEDGKYRRIIEHAHPRTQEERDLKREELARLNYMRNWHWCYRFVMTARTLASYRQEMWKKVMYRIMTIQGVQLDELTTIPFTAADGTAQRRPATIGDALTSELGMGILLRWHVLSPAGVVGARNRGGSAIRAALRDAKAARPALGWSNAPTTWGQAEEDAIIQALKDQATHGSNEMQKSIPKVSAFPGAGRPEWRVDRAHIGALSTRRGSFEFSPSPGYGYFFADDPLNAGGFGSDHASGRVKPGPVRATTISKR